jgi:hypothetical protein
MHQSLCFCLPQKKCCVCTVGLILKPDSLLSSLQLPYELGIKSRESPEARPNQAALLLDTMPTYRKPVAPMCQGKHNTPCDRVSVHSARLATGIASAQWDKTFLPAKPSPNPDDAGPIVHRLMGVLVAGRAWTQTHKSLVAQLALRCGALDHCGRPSDSYIGAVTSEYEVKGGENCN